MRAAGWGGGMTGFFPEQEAEVLAGLHAALERDDASGFCDALMEAQELGIVDEVVKRVVGLQAGTGVKKFFLRFWLRNGDAIRNDASDDLIVLDALRILLPTYGEAELFRGETSYNLERRTYGMSWTSSRELAEQRAGNLTQEGFDSVVLQTVASPAAVICAPCLLVDEHEHQREYVVDRRELREVSVVGMLPRAA